MESEPAEPPTKEPRVPEYERPRPRVGVEVAMLYRVSEPELEATRPPVSAVMTGELVKVWVPVQVFAA